MKKNIWIAGWIVYGSMASWMGFLLFKYQIWSFQLFWAICLAFASFDWLNEGKPIKMFK